VRSSSPTAPGAASADAAAAPFGRRGARWLAAIAGLSLVASGLLAMFADVFEVPSFGPDTFSPSAVGHRAAAALLRDLGFRVVASRSRTADKVTDGAVLVVAEPRLLPAELDPRSGERLEAMLERATRVLLVLPKRLAAPDQLRPRWIAATAPFPLGEAQRVLEAAGVKGKVVRPERSAASFDGPLPTPAIEAPQLVVSDELEPLVSTAEGMLAGERVADGTHLVVLADPDVLATHGLGRADDAVLLVRLLERLGARPGDGPAIVFDETLHGLEAEPSLARELLRWPLVLATLQAALVLALLAWAALIRFGRSRRAQAGLAPGKTLLVENTADLLRRGGHTALIVAAYWRAAREAIAHALRPAGNARADLEGWLANLASSRSREDALAAVERSVAALTGPGRCSEEEALRAARAAHEFREEMTHGARTDP
jgi:hypothetical protein